ncbi:MAG: APC family permease, partial [Firmicutes bacterium]|nr:APC family permease [Bacillota bacterium]
MAQSVERAVSHATRLQANALTFFDNIVIGMASTAPACSLATALGGLVAIMGWSSPLEILINFFPMLGIAIAFYYLNRYDKPSAGGCFTWVSGIMNPHVGYLTGWAIIAAELMDLIAGSVPAGAYTLQMIHPAWVNNTLAVSIVGALWFLVVTAVVVWGIRRVARLQWIMMAFEYAMLIGFSVWAFIKEGSHLLSGTATMWSHFAFHGTFGDFAQGATVAIFIYWGFDTITNVGEESKNPSKNPGKASVFSTFILLALFLGTTMAVESVLSSHAIVHHSDDVLAYFANQLAPAPWGDLMILAVLFSTLATLETGILPIARVAYEMSNKRVFPRVFREIHPIFRNPVKGTLILAALTIIGLFSMNFVTSVGKFLADAVNNIGIMVAFYYGVTGWAAAWYFRRNVLQWKLAIWGIAVPFISGAYLFLMGGVTLWENGWATAWPALLIFLTGIP